MAQQKSMKSDREKQKKKQEEEIKKKKGWYKAVEDTPAMQDLLEFLDKNYKSSISIAKNRQYVDGQGQVANLNNEDCTAFTQRAAAYEVVKNYIERLSS